MKVGAAGIEPRTDCATEQQPDNGCQGSVVARRGCRSTRRSRLAGRTAAGSRYPTYLLTKLTNLVSCICDCSFFTLSASPMPHASIWLHQFLKAMRDPKTGDPLRNAHILGFFRRICKLIFLGIRPVFVFDGAAPALKRATIALRKRRLEDGERSLARTAEKLLQARIKLHTVKAARSALENQDHEEESDGDEDEDVRIVATELAGSKRKRDEYDLPDLPSQSVKSTYTDPGSDPVTDPRMVSESELRAFVNNHRQNLDLSSLSLDSADFAALPVEIQHEIILDLKTQSRESSFRRLSDMLRDAPTSTDFSRLQIQNLVVRNELTWRHIKLVQTAGVSVNPATKKKRYVNTMKRIVAERNKEFVLVKGDDEGGGERGLRKAAAGWVMKARSMFRPNESAVEIGPRGELNVKKSGSGHPSSGGVIVLSDEEDGKSVRGEGDSDSDSVWILPDTDQAVEPPREASRVGEPPPPFDITDSDEEAVFEPIQIPTLPPPFEDSDEDVEFEPVEIDTETLTALFVPDTVPMEAAPTPADPDEDILIATLVNTTPSSASTIERIAVALKAIAPWWDGSARGLVEDVEGWDVEKCVEELRRVERVSGKKGGGDEGVRRGFEAWEALVRSVLERRGGVGDGERGDEEVYEALEDEIDARSPRALSDSVEVPECNMLSPRVFSDVVEYQVEVHSRRGASPREVDAPRTLNTSIEVRSVSPVHSVASEGPATPEGFQVLENRSPSLGSSPRPPPPPRPQAPSPVTLPLFSRTPSPDIPDAPANIPGVVPGAVTDDAIFLEPHEVDGAVDVPVALTTEESEYARFVSSLSSQPLESIQHALEDDLERLRAEKARGRRDAAGLSGEMVEETKDVLRLFGLPFVVAPTEAESQCACLESLGIVDGIVTDDSDVFLFGGKKVFRNFFDSAKYVERYDAVELEETLKLDRDKLVRLAYLLGSDYTPGVQGVGIVSAVEILDVWRGEEGLEEFARWCERVHKGLLSVKEVPKDKKKFFRLANKIELPERFPDPRVRESYLKPTVDDDDTDFTWGIPDLDAIRAYMLDKLGWAPSKTDEVLLPVVRECTKRLHDKKQTTLDRYFGSSPTKRVGAKVKSARLRKVVAGWIGEEGVEDVVDLEAEMDAARGKKARRKKTGDGAAAKKRKRDDDEEGEGGVGESGRGRGSKRGGRGRARGRARGSKAGESP
ncbi:hypothetical protein BJ742DRAFT_857452 [Cladochytrium replicatum]|nr:hypothetical protein BJ742DRAFT_857452 [Cladochytrium replicatum]